MLKLPFRSLPMLLSAVLVAGLYWGLNEADSRAIYAPWDKLLHGSVFFLIWWLARSSLHFSWLWVSLLVIIGGGLEEIHQIWEPDHYADWYDWYADIAGVAMALAIYGVGRLLHRLYESVSAASDNGGLYDAELGKRLPILDSISQRGSDDKGTRSIGANSLGERGDASHAVDLRGVVHLWRWDFYFVFLLGSDRRALTRNERKIARRWIGFFIFLFLVVSVASGILVLFLIETALGFKLLPVLQQQLISSWQSIKF